MELRLMESYNKRRGEEEEGVRRQPSHPTRTACPISTKTTPLARRSWPDSQRRYDPSFNKYPPLSQKSSQETRYSAGVVF